MEEIQLVTVEIETTQGSIYEFPDMDKRILEKSLAQDEMWRKLGSVALSNASGACLVVPVRIIKQICLLRFNAETLMTEAKILWEASPASTASSP